MLSRQNGVKVEALLRFSFSQISILKMITLIAESKTMKSSLKKISLEVFQNNKPYFQGEADEIMEFIQRIPINEIAQRIKISTSLAIKAAEAAYEFPNKTQGNEAILEFSGEVFRALNIGSLDSNNIDKRLLIISSLYGILKPNDIIRPYRLDFKSDCNPFNVPLYNFWKERNTGYILKYMNEHNEHEILNLLPVEAEKCINWNILRPCIKIEKPSFKIVDIDAKLKTPHTGRLKELRGLLLRHILKYNINCFKDLFNISTNEFGFDINNSHPGVPLVLCSE